MSTESSITEALNALSSEGGRWLWKSRLRDGLRAHLPKALLLLMIVPAFALGILAMGWLFGQPWKLAVALLVFLWPQPTLGYLAWQLHKLWLQQPSRREGLAVFDERFRLKDRLQTADEFLTTEIRTPFMEAAVEDTEVAVKSAYERPLDWEWGDPWPELKRLAFIPVVALALLLLCIFLPAAGRSSAKSSEEQPMAAAEPGKNHPLPTRRDPQTASSKRTDVTPPKGEPGPQPKEGRRKTNKGEPTPSKTSEKRSPQIAGREKISLGESEGGQTSQATSAGRSSQSRGNPGSQAPTSTPEKKPATPKKKKNKPKDPKEDKKSEKKRKKLEDKSGATAGRGSSSGSSRNPASTDWASKDRTEETESEEFEQEEDVDDEESESEARGGLQPSLRDRRPPVNRDLSIGFGNRANPDANGRGGPGQRKKSRGVASLVLGVPVPDHVKGQPNPGRVKINQERVQPQREESPIVDAEDRGKRSAPAGRVPERTLDANMRRIVRDYFLKSRESASGSEPSSTSGDGT